MGAVGGIIQGVAGIAGVAQGYHESNTAQGMSEDATWFTMQNMELADQLDSLMSYYGDLGIESAQGLLDQWEASFGGVEANLADYYNNLDPLKYSQEAKTSYAKNLDKQMKQYQETLTQRGLTSSGQRAQLEKEAMFTKASKNADIDIAAPDTVAQMKMGWLGQGENLRGQANNAMQSAIDNAARYTEVGTKGMMSANTDTANILTGHAASAGQSASGWMQAGGSLLGQGFSNLNDYYNRQDNTSTGNLPDGTTIDASNWGAN